MMLSLVTFTFLIWAADTASAQWTQQTLALQMNGRPARIPHTLSYWPDLHTWNHPWLFLFY